jgi:hypothetical protein
MQADTEQSAFILYPLEAEESKKKISTKLLGTQCHCWDSRFWQQLSLQSGVMFRRRSRFHLTFADMVQR